MNIGPDASGASPGMLITRVRGYNLTVGLLFGGRRTAVNRALARAAGVAPGHHVLDVGSGPGRFAQALADAAGPGGLVLGVDPSPAMVEYANRHAGRRASCRFDVAAAQDLQLPDQSFDVVTSTFVMHHIPEEHRGTALGHMYRVLRPGGRLLIADLYPTGRLGPILLRIVTRFGHSHDHSHGDSPGDSHEHSHGQPSGGSHAEESHAGGHSAGLDVRQYAEPLTAAGFTVLGFGVLKPWTGYLTAIKPD